MRKNRSSFVLTSRLAHILSGLFIILLVCRVRGGGRGGEPPPPPPPPSLPERGAAVRRWPPQASASRREAEEAGAVFAVAGFPKVHEQDVPVFSRVVVRHGVDERVVEHQHLALLPRPGLLADVEPGAGWHDQPEVGRQALVVRAWQCSGGGAGQPGSQSARNCAGAYKAGTHDMPLAGAHGHGVRATVHNILCSPVCGSSAEPADSR
eukprot:SAG22_NODE_937_length_6418_cov_124.858680_8_plen_208_part_00